MGIKVYDNYEDDGQLSMFDAEGQEEEFPERSEQKQEVERGADIRIRNCSSCGKLLFVREENDAFFSACNNCGISYCQKK